MKANDNCEEIISDLKPGQRLISSMLTSSYVDRREFVNFDHHKMEAKWGGEGDGGRRNLPWKSW